MEQAITPEINPIEKALACIERFIAPGYSSCGRCGRPWKFVNGHITKTSDTNGCFPLCESCWEKLGTPQAREPYYRDLWVKWVANDSPISWEDIRSAVYAETP